MANRLLFGRSAATALAPTNTVNAAGAAAYAFSPQHQLAQYAVTGCLNQVFYADAEAQLGTVLALCENNDAEFIAKLAIYAREQAAMKDMPVLLLAVLTNKAPELLPAVFHRVINNGKQLRNYVQMLRSGVLGRRSLGTRPKRLVQQWLNQASDAQLIGAMIGQQPSLADVIKMVHPRPDSVAREALFAYVIDKPYNANLLPVPLQSYLQYKADQTRPVPDVNLQLLTALPLDKNAWTQIARNAPWRTTLMNLNTFARHGVLDDKNIVAMIAARLRDAKAIERARAYPYQLLAAWRAAVDQMPNEIAAALQDALDIALTNVPPINGQVVICPDVSGSMASSVSGHRKGATSKVRCIDVAALTAAALLRRNESARVLPFEYNVVKVRLNPRDSVITNAEKLAKIGGGGTNCSAPLELLNKEKAVVDTVIFVSDNQSWVDARTAGASEMLRQWQLLKQRNPLAKLICIDIQPYGNSPAPDQADVLNVGGFSDSVFDQIAWFTGNTDEAHWIQQINAVSLQAQ